MRKKKQKRKKKTKSRKKSKRIKSRKKSKRIKKAKKSESKELIFKVPKKWSNNAYIDKNKYEKKYKLSIKDNDGFWKKEGKRIDWIKAYTKIKDVKYSTTDVKIKWYYDGTLNASANCIDRHLKDKKNKTAIIWVGDDPKDSKEISYKELHRNVCKAANGLKELGIKKGDRVTIYLTMIPELAYVMLACARIGAVHSIIFGGFSPDSIAGRINDCKSDYIITADEGIRGGKIIPLKKITDEALEQCPNVKKCVVVKRTGNKVNWIDGRDVSYDEITTINGVTKSILAILQESSFLGEFSVFQTEFVGPKVGRNLQRQAVSATCYALLGVLIYIAIRFKGTIYGAAAVIAVFHDVIITLGFFSFADREISLTVIAALLTLVGYSMNDTIVVFDRIRENLRLSRRIPLSEIINKSINQTLSRTLLTSGSTFLTALSLYFLGGQVINGFAFALVFGVAIGTYSSIGVASPLLLLWHDYQSGKKK